MNIWQQLDIKYTTDQRLIRGAYARRLKQMHPEDDPEGFKDLRTAYEQVLKAVIDQTQGDRFDNDYENELTILPPSNKSTSTFEFESQSSEDIAKNEEESDVSTVSDDENQDLWQDMQQMLDTLDDEIVARHEENIISILQNIVDKEYMQMIDSRIQLELTLLYLFDLHNMPHRLVPESLISEFSWEEGVDHLDENQAETANAIAAYSHTVEHLEALKKQARGWWIKGFIFPDSVAAYTLTTTSPAWLLQTFQLLFMNLNDAVINMLGALDAKNLHIFKYLSNDNITWWNNNGRDISGSRALLIYTVQSFWFYFILLWILLKLTLISFKPWFIPPLLFISFINIAHETRDDDGHLKNIKTWCSNIYLWCWLIFIFMIFLLFSQIGLNSESELTLVFGIILLTIAASLRLFRLYIFYASISSFLCLIVYNVLKNYEIISSQMPVAVAIILSHCMAVVFCHWKLHK